MTLSSSQVNYPNKYIPNIDNIKPYVLFQIITTKIYLLILIIYFRNNISLISLKFFRNVLELNL